MNAYRVSAALATVLFVITSALACSVTHVEDSTPSPLVVLNVDGGAWACGSPESPICVGANGEQGVCALSTVSGNPTCCTGCVGSDGFCRSGDTSNVCGSGGDKCLACDLGESCSGGACHTNCRDNEGTPCVDGRGVKGVIGNGPDGTCVCCSGCFDPYTGICSAGTFESACGAEGHACVHCGGFPLACVNGACQVP